MNPHLFPALLSQWPEHGARNFREANRLRRLSRTAGLRVNPYIPKAQLKKTATRFMLRTSAVPWKYQRFLKPNVNVYQQATNIQPGAIVPISFNGQETKMHIDTVRRISFRGKPWFLEVKCKIDTEHMPITLQRESKCDCAFCGTTPRGDDEACQKCGAPLSC